MNKLSTIIIACLSMVCMYLIIATFIGLPIVHKSISSNQCVEVWSPDDEYSCSNMPTKYETVWVN